MSVERVERSTGVVWRVRWRDEQGRNRSKALGRKRDAEAFDAEVRRMKRTRDLGRLDAGKETLGDFGQEWWKLYAAPNLSESTLRLYAWLWDSHVLPHLGGYQLRDLTPELIQRYRVELEANGGRAAGDAQGADAPARSTPAGGRVGADLDEPRDGGPQAEGQRPPVRLPSAARGR